MTLLTVDNCPPCLKVKAYITSKSLVIPVVHYTRVRETWTKEQLSFVNDFHVQSFPTLITEDDGVVVGADNIVKYLKNQV